VNRQDQDYLDWFLVQAETRLRRQIWNSVDAAADLVEFLRPVSEPYPHELNPIFLCACG
jgi:hypothetical protein